MVGFKESGGRGGGGRGGGGRGSASRHIVPEDIGKTTRGQVFGLQKETQT
jgi:hypothetical protein